MPTELTNINHVATTNGAFQTDKTVKLRLKKNKRTTRPKALVHDKLRIGKHQNGCLSPFDGEPAV